MRLCVLEENGQWSGHIIILTYWLPNGNVIDNGIIFKIYNYSLYVYEF